MGEIHELFVLAFSFGLVCRGDSWQNCTQKRVFFFTARLCRGSHANMLWVILLARLVEEIPGKSSDAPGHVRRAQRVWEQNYFRETKGGVENWGRGKHTIKPLPKNLFHIVELAFLQQNGALFGPKKSDFRPFRTKKCLVRFVPKTVHWHIWFCGVFFAFSAQKQGFLTWQSNLPETPRNAKICTVSRPECQSASFSLKT